MPDVAIAATHEIETRDIEYCRSEDGPLLARLYQPKGNGPFPALLEVHGGAWASGDRLNNAPLDEALAKSGIVVFAVDFRMPPRHRYPASIADIHYATRWLKAHAAEFGSRADLVAGLGTSSGAHQLLLSALRPDDARYAALPLAEAPAADARLPYLVLCWPISDPLARYRMVKEKGRTPLIQSHDAYWASEAEMAEGNPQRIVESGEAERLPAAILLQGTGDDNVTPDMADRFAAAWRTRGGAIDLHKFDGEPHTFVIRDPASDASRRACELARDFVRVHARV
ncbi:MAG: alpha/beta hydrolase [Alphaproteobacteria bacterium]|nr:alpha/beta hydrolase [Alphaproteobacteria bacterium]